jgi:hypothetical protein
VDGGEGENEGVSAHAVAPSGVRIAAKRGLWLMAQGLGWLRA